MGGGEVDYDRLRKLSAEIKALKTPTIEIPPCKPGVPFSVEQGIGVEFMYKMGRSIIADEIGIGKTAEAIKFLEYLAINEGCERFLVLVSASILLQWVEEIVKYAPTLQIEIIRSSRWGNSANRKYKYNSIRMMGHRPVVVVASYDMAVSDLAEMYTMDWDAIVVDESSVIKNTTTQRFNAVNILGKVPRWMAHLTATPLENDVMDLYANVQILYPGYLGDEAMFRDKYVIEYEIPIKVSNSYYRKVKKVAGYKRLEELRQATEWMMLRRLPEEVGIKYPKMETHRIFLDMLPLQKKVYVDLKEGILQSSRSVRKIKLLAKFKYLFMCTDGSLASHIGLSCKVPATLGLIDAFMASGKKVVIFSHSKRVVNHLEPLIKAKGLSVLRITGDEDQNIRYQSMQLFNNDPEYKVMLITTAGSRGINLPGAWNLIMYNQTYNPALNKQIFGRLMRRTQESDIVNIYELYAKRSIEKSLRDILDRKKDLFNRVIEGKAESALVAKNIGVNELMLALRSDGSEEAEDGKS
jgi:SNF2 family DNA or RNA helicase